MSPSEFNEMLNKLRRGEEVICPLCNKGVMVPVGDYKITHGFHCSHCKKRLNLD